MSIENFVSTWEVRDWLAFISAITALAAVLTSAVVNGRTLWQKANETELKAIQDQLDGFYGPLIQRNELNSMLSRDLRARQPDSGQFLLLEKLFDQAWRSGLDAGQAALVDELAANAKSNREFIARGTVSAPLLPYLARVSAHYRVIELAAANALGEDAKPWIDQYVYPKQFDRVVALEMERLRARAALLRKKPGRAPGPAKPLEIPENLQLIPWVAPPRDPRKELTMPANQS